MASVGKPDVVFDVLPGATAKDGEAGQSADIRSRVCSLPDDDAAVPWVGEVHAYRAFRVTGDGLLRSLSTTHTWSRGTNAAGCRSGHCAAAAAGQPGTYPRPRKPSPAFGEDIHRRQSIEVSLI
ncbi:MAG: hypothetical protein JWM76_1348 [Pseudonocardiales bacterium]|nr:hypothetical protein [Pseudonocardiales bacterium]